MSCRADQPHAVPIRFVKLVQNITEELLASTLPLMKAPPVNLSIICDRLGVEVYAMPGGSLGAVSSRSRDGEKKFLTVNSKLPQGRFRFSIAHELGHILLNHEPLRHIFERNREAEGQADFFASALLLPENLVRPDCADYTMTELAKRYKVSRQALELRLNYLGLKPKA